MKRWLFHPPLLALLPLAAAAGKPRDLAPALQPLADKYHLPGVVGAILHGDDVVAIGSVGIRKSGDPSPFLPTDIIHLGSDTKAMTAMLIGQLIDKKQIAFDSTMAELFPELAAQMNTEMARVTVRNLLDHTAGFPHDLKWGALQGAKLPLPELRRRAVKQALSVAPATPIGKISYSNISYFLLGAIVEAKTGKPWEDVIRQGIFRPLHMETAGFGPPGTPGKVDQPWGHVLRNDLLVPLQSDNPEVMGPAGTVHCSMEDWSKFHRRGAARCARASHAGLRGDFQKAGRLRCPARITPAVGSSRPALGRVAAR